MGIGAFILYWEEEEKVAVVNRLRVECKSELIFEYIWAIWVEICSWIVF